MTRAVLWVCPALTLLSVIVLGVRDPTRVATVIIIGLLTGWVVFAVQVGRVRRLARTVNSWAADQGRDRLELRGGTRWLELGTSLNALGGQLQDARDELRSLVPWTERLVSSLGEPAVVIGPDRRVVAANRAAVDDLNLPVAGSPPTVLSALGSAAAADAVDEAAEVGRIVTVDDAQGDRQRRVTASPLDDHVLVVVSDQTQQRRIEELRRDFVTNASHELKTPVSAITMLVEALRVAPPARRDQLVERLEEETLRLTRLVRDLLDLRQLEGGDRDEQHTAVDLSRLVRDAVDAHAASAHAADVTLEADVAQGAVVAGVQRELRLVADNLVGNAVQYNRAGGEVEVTLEVAAGEAVLVVRDTGIGIPQAATARVFERFYRVDVARSRESGGTGLGLSLVRNAVERHHGSVTLESLLGVGTTVTVHLPVQGGS